MLIITTVKEPWRLQTAVASLWSAWLAVLATLKLEFARTTAMALGVVDLVKFPIVRFGTPTLLAILGPEGKHWAVPLIESGLSIFAIIVAWYLQMVISAFYSALRGGRMFAEAFFELLTEKGWIEQIPGIQLPFDPN